MKQNFEKILPLLLKDEGGFSNDPDDAGGATNFGITIADVRKYINKDATAQDVRNLTIDQAKSIYKSKYWDALGCDDLSSGVDYTCFDYGVNSGLGRPRNALKKFSTLKGAKLIDAINDEREEFLHNIGVGHNSKFLRGWLARVSRVRSKSKQLASTDNALGPIVGSAVGGATISLSSLWHNHELLIIGGGLTLAIVVAIIVHLIRNKGK
jgi:lysozyme family protein